MSNEFYELGDAFEVTWEDGAKEVYMLSVSGDNKYNLVCIQAEKPIFVGRRLTETVDNITKTLVDSSFNSPVIVSWRKINVTVNVEDEHE